MMLSFFSSVFSFSTIVGSFVGWDFGLSSIVGVDGLSATGGFGA